jgi:hypothetical protein
VDKEVSRRREDVSLGYWLAVQVSNHQGEHDELFDYEELPGDDCLFNGNDKHGGYVLQKQEGLYQCAILAYHSACVDTPEEN